jgi:hypothetical protein
MNELITLLWEGVGIPEITADKRMSSTPLLSPSYPHTQTHANTHIHIHPLGPSTFYHGMI